MAINRIIEPNVPPTETADWSRMLNLVRALQLSTELPFRVVGSNVVKGAVFAVGGTIYQADADTAISGTTSNYVKLTPSTDGSVCTASYVASLTGVSWNSTYNGWYDSSENAYIFDENIAFDDGKIATIYNQKNIAIRNTRVANADNANNADAVTYLKKLSLGGPGSPVTEAQIYTELTSLMNITTSDAYPAKISCSGIFIPSEYGGGLTGATSPISAIEFYASSVSFRDNTNATIVTCNQGDLTLVLPGGQYEWGRIELVFIAI